MKKDFEITFGNLSLAEQKCLEYTTSSVTVWLNGVVQSQVEFAKVGIINALKEHCFANGIVPAETDEAKVLQAYELGLVKTAAQVKAEWEAAEAARIAAAGAAQQE